MADEAANEGVSHNLSDDELLERGYYGIDQLVTLRTRAERLGLTVMVRAVGRENQGDEPYVYVIEGGGPEGEAVASASLGELETRLRQLEQGAS